MTYIRLSDAADGSSMELREFNTPDFSSPSILSPDDVRTSHLAQQNQGLDNRHTSLLIDTPAMQTPTSGTDSGPAGNESTGWKHLQSYERYPSWLPMTGILRYTRVILLIVTVTLTITSSVECFRVGCMVVVGILGP